MVMDCAAKFQDLFLNDSLLQGPNLTNSLLDVLLRFRQERIASVGNIEEMFFQALVDPQHRDLLRFLSWKDDNLKM